MLMGIKKALKEVSKPGVFEILKWYNLVKLVF